MNLNMIQPKIETEDLLISITKNCEKLIEQTHRKAADTLEFKMNNSRETFHFKPPIQFKGDWMLGLKDLGVYSSIVIITKHKDKFGLYKFPDKKVVVFHTRKSETRSKETWIFQILHPPIYKMK